MVKNLAGLSMDDPQLQTSQEQSDPAEAQAETASNETSGLHPETQTSQSAFGQPSAHANEAEVEASEEVDRDKGGSIADKTPLQTSQSHNALISQESMATPKGELEHL